MKRLTVKFILWICLLLSLVFLPACSTTNKPSENHMEHEMGANHGRGHDSHTPVPHEYMGKTSPFTNDENVVLAGQQIFEANCAVCHGLEGKGDGVGATNLNPQPANFTDHAMMNMVGDDYLFWRISEGGVIEPFNSAMPSWKTSLSEVETWQVISYIRTLPKH